VINGVFAGNCPLWTYILAEARHHAQSVNLPVLENHSAPPSRKIHIETPKLGPVGGRIVAEVMLGLIFGDRNSLLNVDPLWQPTSNGEYALRDFVKFALG
jgi:hypothetical protein